LGLVKTAAAVNNRGSKETNVICSAEYVHSSDDDSTSDDEGDDDAVRSPSLQRPESSTRNYSTFEREEQTVIQYDSDEEEERESRTRGQAELAAMLDDISVVLPEEIVSRHDKIIEVSSKSKTEIKKRLELMLLNKNPPVEVKQQPIPEKGRKKRIFQSDSEEEKEENNQREHRETPFSFKKIVNPEPDSSDEELDYNNQQQSSRQQSSLFERHSQVVVQYEDSNTRTASQTELEIILSEIPSADPNVLPKLATNGQISTEKKRKRRKVIQDFSDSEEEGEQQIVQDDGDELTESKSSSKRKVLDSDSEEEEQEMEMVKQSEDDGDEQVELQSKSHKKKRMNVDEDDDD